MEESKDHTTKVKALYADIFGGDSDDDDDDDAKIDNTVSNRLTETTKVITSSNNTRKIRDDDDDLFADSDDDNNATGGKVGDHEDEDDIFKPSSSSKAIVINEDNLFDSDDEGEENTTSIFQSSIRMKRPKGRMSQSKGKDKNKDKKISKKRKLNKSSKPNDDSDNDDSGDAYDSGEEVKETAEDRNFIDEDDDFADVVKEYDEDNTDFRDDYDEDNDYNSSKKGKKGGRKGGVDSDIRRSLTVNATRDTDPLSLTLLAMKNPKAKVMSESDKERFVEKLQRKMAEAVELDDELFRQQQPAIHKMQLLESVQIALSMKPMHQTFLEKDILGTLRDWIEPRDASTLPALSVRTAIYEILLQLPCQPDQLKRTSGNRPPIGAIIVMLRKHKMETAENKRILKDIMDKWSRPIFSKSTDIRISGNGGVLLSTDHQEVQEAINQRYTDDTSGGMDYNHHHLQNTSKGGMNNSRGAHIPVGFDAIMSQQTNTEPTQRINAQFSRARTPYNKGFLFTVQPELKNIDKRNIMEKALGEERMKLYKKITTASRGKNSGLGKKLNPR